MTQLVLYIFMAIVQGQGVQAEAHGTLEDCIKSRTEVIAKPDVLAASECTKVELNRILPKA